jgi:3-hydroxyanthranilate 3,4-dioxygenase
LFYQLEGSIKVIIQEDGIRKEMELNAGDMYLHPAKVPHSPVRSEGSIGLVIERKRAAQGYVDGLLVSVITVTINYTMCILNSTISISCLILSISIQSTYALVIPVAL